MTRRCEPPTEWLTNDDIPYHWVCHKHDDEPSIARFRAQGSPPLTSLYVDEELASEANGWRYLAPCRPDDATERLRLEAENARLKNLVKTAYNEGFVQGMREHTSSRGGKPWRDSDSFKWLSERHNNA